MVVIVYNFEWFEYEGKMESLPVGFIFKDVKKFDLHLLNGEHIDFSEDKQNIPQSIKLINNLLFFDP